MIRRSVLMALGLFALGAAPAAAELKHTTVYKEHRVVGTTARALWQDMIAHPIIDPDDGPAYSNITHDHALTFKTATSRRDLSGHRSRLHLEFRHHAAAGGKLCEHEWRSRKMWQQFTTYLKGHEERHGAIFLECGKSFVPAAEKMTGPAGCAGLDEKVRAFVDRQYAACMVKQRDFDRSQRTTVDGSRPDAGSPPGEDPNQRRHVNCVIRITARRLKSRYREARAGAAPCRVSVTGSSPFSASAHSALPCSPCPT